MITEQSTLTTEQKACCYEKPLNFPVIPKEALETLFGALGTVPGLAVTRKPIEENPVMVFEYLGVEYLIKPVIASSLTTDAEYLAYYGEQYVIDNLGAM